jgi:hypothetical protein
MPLHAIFGQAERTGLVRVLDLATGTGANLRYLAPRIGGPQEWLLTDRDRRLLDALPRCMETWARSAGYETGGTGHSRWIAGPGFHCTFRPLRLDLAPGLGLARLPIRGWQLVTASALLDLVSEQWIESLVARCLAENAHVLFALTYDGRVKMQPSLSDDALITNLVNRHQRIDKGFGRALGPDAPGVTQAKLLDRSYRVSRRASDWHIGNQDAGLQASLIRGWAGAAMEAAPESRAAIGSWCAARLALLSEGQSRLVVGHQDLLGLCARAAQNRNAPRAS